MRPTPSRKATSSGGRSRLSSEGSADGFKLAVLQNMEQHVLSPLEHSIQSRPEAEESGYRLGEERKVLPHSAGD